MNKKILKKYAELILRSGVNLDRGQTLVVSADICAHPLVREIAAQAYECGAAKVIVKWDDKSLSPLDYKYQSLETLTDIPKYIIDERDEWADKACPYIVIVGNDPDLLAGCDSGKVSARLRKFSGAINRWRDAQLSNRFHWTVVAYPTAKWAKKVFPELPERQAVSELWTRVIKAVRLDCADPIDAWEKHSARLAGICGRLNGENIDSLHYKSGNGTDFTVGLPDNYVFTGGRENGSDGRPFNANLPTEEVFTAPHRLRADGVVYGSLPLAHQGKIIDKIRIRFSGGEAVEFSAETGEDVLKNIISSDEGSRRLGEVALVPYDSPLQDMGLLFYETLFDENASCHLALGGAYASSVSGGEAMSGEQRLAAGLNSSCEHVDFMIGSPDLEITATRKDGSSFKVFTKGRFAF